jgi:hypothetical protein
MRWLRLFSRSEGRKDYPKKIKSVSLRTNGGMRPPATLTHTSWVRWLSCYQKKNKKRHTKHA